QIQGRDLRGDTTLVIVDGFELPAAAVAPDRVSVPLASPVPAGLYAGVKGVQVVQPFKMGDPATDHRGLESNIAAFVLRPTITNGPALPASAVIGKVATTVTIDGTVVQLRAGQLELACDPAVGRNQRVTPLLNQYNPPAS